MVKIGRNELCPCGSGKKYKKCCLGQLQAAPAAQLSLVPSSPNETIIGTVVHPLAEPAAAGTEKTASKAEKMTLPKLRKLVSRDLDWLSESHEQVGLSLIEEMRKGYDKELIYEGIMLWNGYSRVVKPVVKKAGVFCAAIEYYLSEEYGLQLTAGDLAKKYEVTPVTVTRRFKELGAYAEEYDPTGSALPPELLIAALKGSDREKAAELVRRAKESGTSGRAAVRLAEAALELYPDLAEAYLILADEAPDEHEGRKLLNKGMEAARRELGEERYAGSKGLFWDVPEGRTYLNICRSYAESCWFGGRVDEAADVLKSILELDAGDHTGARYLLLAAYLYSDRLEEAERVLEQYGEDDGAAAFAYDRIILEFKRHGVTSRLKMLYRVATGVNKHVPDYLLGVRVLPYNLPDFIGRGDANEAIEYVILHSRLWASLPELLKWMLKQ